VHYPQAIHLDYQLLVLAVSILLLFYLGVWLFAAKQSASSNVEEQEKWFVPAIGLNTPNTSFFHQWDVRIKIASLFSYCLFISMISKPGIALLALLASLSAAYLAKIPLSRLLRRLAALTVFLSMFAVLLPFTAAHKAADQLIYFDPLPVAFNLRGLQIALTLVCKAVAIAIMMEPLFNTAPLPKTVQGLQQLGVPKVVCQMALMAHRYIFVFLHEAKRMSTGMRVRGFQKRTDMETMRVLGNFVGMLLVRSIDRTERVYQAMLARGYNGTFPSCYTFQAQCTDWLLGLVWLGIALLLLFLDADGIF
jgi:cobalt/nickel transport system permease protein